MPKQKGKGLVWTLGFLLDQEATYLGHKTTHLILDQVEFGLDQRRLNLSFVKTNHKTLTHWPNYEKNGMKMKWREREFKYQIQLIKYEPSHHQSMPNRKEMKITSQQVNHNFFGNF
jgi:hypothetical protein